MLPGSHPAAKGEDRWADFFLRGSGGGRYDFYDCRGLALYSLPSKDSHSRQLRALRAVASVEFLKGLVVLLAGFGVLSLVHRDAWDVAESFLEWLHISPDGHYAQVFLNLADQVTDRKVWAVAIGALAYSSLRFAESYGLWRERPWAEWLALVSGAVYLPFEIYELARKPDWVRLAIFLINLAVVIYMAFLRLQARERTDQPVPVADSAD
jgi:uncharacterized membrane protein (DUF2068 family)